jgi:hypothetical protein
MSEHNYSVTRVSVLDNSSCPDICLLTLGNRNVRGIASTIQLSNTMADEPSDGPADITYVMDIGNYRSGKLRPISSFHFYSVLLD